MFSFRKGHFQGVRGGWTLSKSLVFTAFQSLIKGKALGTKLLQAALSGFIWAYASLSEIM